MITKKTRISLCFLFVFSSLSSSLWAKAEWVYLKDDGNSRQIFLERPDGEAQQLTFGDNWHLYPAISSSGEKIAYVAGPTPNKLSLYILDREKNHLLRLGKTQGLVVQPRFARQGERIYFSAPLGNEGKNQIAYYDLKKLTQNHSPQIKREAVRGRVREVHFYDVKPEVIKTQKNAFFPSPSSDASLLAYHTSDREENREVILREMSSGEETVINEHGMAPSFSKDDLNIAFTQKVEGNWDVYIYNRLTEKTVRATRDPARDFAPSFDRHGHLIFATTRLEHQNFAIARQEKSSWQNGNFRIDTLKDGPKSNFYTAKFGGLAKYQLQETSSIPGPNRSSFGALYHRGKVYVSGGHKGAEHTYPPESFSNLVYAYDVKTGEWEKLPRRPSKAHGYELAAYGQYLYAFGGFAYEEDNSPKWKSLDVIERYDIKNRRWEVIGHMPRRRSSNVVATVGHKAYLIGGWDSTPKFDGDFNGTFHSQIDVFNLKTEEIKESPHELPKKRRAFNAVVREGNILLVGGISEGASQFNLIKNVTRFNPQTGEFTELKPLPFGTFAPATGVLNNKLFVFGGMLKTGKMRYEYFSHIYQMDLDEQTWEHTGRYLSESKGFSQVVRWQDKLGILGGHTYQDDRDEPVKTFEVFEIKSSQLFDFESFCGLK